MQVIFRKWNHIAAGAILLLSLNHSAWAGLAGQPKPSTSAATAIQSAARDIADRTDIGAARPSLFLAVEDNITADITDLLAPALVDDTTFNGVRGTLEDAVDKKTGDDSRYVRYNLARLYLLRARILRQGTARDKFLRAGAKVAEPLTTGSTRDAAALDLSGDLYAESGDLASATAEYGKMQTVAGADVDGFPVRAYTPYKIALAQQHANRFDASQRSFESAIRADAVGGSGGHQLRHLIYQGLASLYLQQGNDPAALQALAFSVRVTPDTNAPLRLRSDVARQLRQRGHTREVASYAAAALKLTPDDPALQSLAAAGKR